MKAKASLSFLFAAVSFTALGSPAWADAAKFYTGGAGYTGPFSGAGTVYAATSGLATNCPTPAGGCPGADVLSNPQNYNLAQGVNLQASATDTAGATNVFGDFQPAFGGMGVGATTASDDQINLGEVLTLHFSAPIQLTGIATLFDPAHSPFGPGFDPTTV